MGSETVNGVVVAAPSPQQVARPDHSTPQLSGDSAGSRFQRPEGGGLQWANPELNQIALAIKDLQGRLEKANAPSGGTENTEAAEFEIGRILVEAQRFSDSALTHLETKLHEVLLEAETKARQILAEATEEAHQIRRHAQTAVFASTHAVHDLRSAIAGFASVNAELLEELVGLNDMLAPGTRNDVTQEIDGPQGSTLDPSPAPRS